jgi:ATP-dependent 26S proteasome regulatory subunit
MTTDSVLFFDEADAILSRRIANVSHAADYGINTAKSTLLTLLDSFSTVTIFATNLFENYDSAFLRRILFHISFPMPGVDQRTKLWELHLPEKIPKIITYRRAAELSEGLSGGDIRNLSIKLALQILTNRIATVDEASLSAQLESYQRTGRVHQTRVLGAVPISGEEMCTS